MTDVEVYVLSDADCQAIFVINATYPRGPQIIVCDHGSGPCVGELLIDDAMYSEWKISLDALVPFSSRSTTTVTINDVL